MREVSPPKFEPYQDDWGTTREGYEDLRPGRPVRAHSHEGGSLLKSVGSMAIVGGIFWGTYLVARSGDVANFVATLQQNHGPIIVIGLGTFSSLLGKYLRI